MCPTTGLATTHSVSCPEMVDRWVGRLWMLSSQRETPVAKGSQKTGRGRDPILLWNDCTNSVFFFSIFLSQWPWNDSIYFNFGFFQHHQGPSGDWFPIFVGLSDPEDAFPRTGRWPRESNPNLGCYVIFPLRLPGLPCDDIHDHDSISCNDGCGSQTIESDP